MVLDGQENVSKLCLCGTPRVLRVTLRHYYTELRGEHAEVFEIFILRQFHSFRLQN
jgi:hypothetical protein